LDHPLGYHEPSCQKLRLTQLQQLFKSRDSDVPKRTKHLLLLSAQVASFLVHNPSSAVRMEDPIITNFFSQYPDFSYQYSWNDDWRQVIAFNAMATDLRWPQDRRKREYQNFKDTWIEVAKKEFEGDSLDRYTTLCNDLQIVPGESIGACKEKLRAVNVNLVDLIQYRKEKRAGWNPPPVRQFSSAEELMRYSRSENKTLSVEAAKAGMLGVLLKIGEDEE